MADLSDVENSLVSLVASILFPGVTYLAGAFQASSVAGSTLKIYRGWPENSTLDADLANGLSHVAVFAEPGMTRLMSRYAPEWMVATPAAVGIAASVSGQAVTLSGTPAAGQAVSIQYGPGTTRSAANYALTGSDTLATAAMALAALIPGATASAGAVTLPSSAIGIAAIVGIQQTAQIEVRRQQQGVRVSCFCPSPAVRDAICSTVDEGVAGMVNSFGNLTLFMPLSDGTDALVRYRATYIDDKPSKDRLWRRDLCYSIEYGTFVSQTQTEMLAGAAVSVVPSSATTFTAGAS